MQQKTLFSLHAATVHLQGTDSCQEPRNDHWQKPPLEKFAIELPATDERKTPGSKLVAASRPEKLEDLAIGNPSHTLNKTDLKRIGTGPAFAVRSQFQQHLKDRAEATQQRTKLAITALDPAEGRKTFEGGCDFLLNWHNNNFDQCLHAMQRGASILHTFSLRCTRIKKWHTVVLSQ